MLAPFRIKIELRVRPKPLDRPAQALFERRLRTPARRSLESSDVRLQRHYLTRRVSDLAEAERERRVNHVAHRLHDIAQTVGLARTEVEDALDALGRRGQMNRLRRVGDVDVIPTLLARRERRALAPRERADEVRNHPLGAVLRAVGRKKSKPHEAHAGRRREVFREQIRAEFRDAVGGHRLCARLFVEDSVLRAESDEGADAELYGETQKGDAADKVFVEVRVVVALTTADAVPSQVKNRVGRELSYARLGLRQFSQVASYHGHARQRLFEPPK